MRRDTGLNSALWGFHLSAHTLGKDIVPLVDNCEFQESDEGRS